MNDRHGLNATFVKGKLLQATVKGAVGRIHLEVFADWCKAKRPQINWTAEYTSVCTDSKKLAFSLGNQPLYTTELPFCQFDQLDGSVVTTQVNPNRKTSELSYVVVSRLGDPELAWIASFKITETTLYGQNAGIIGGAAIITLDQLHSKVPLKDPEQVKAASVIADLLHLDAIWVFIPEPQAA